MKYKNIDEFRKIYEEWKESNLSVRSFCITMGLNESHFYYWKRKLNTPAPPSPGSFIPVQMKSCTDGTIALSGKQVPEQKSSVQDAANRDFCEIVYPNGVTLRIGANLTLDMLRTLIALNP